MISYNIPAKLVAVVLAVASMSCASVPARAESGISLWLDSIFAAPAKPVVTPPANRASAMHDVKPVRLVAPRGAAAKPVVFATAAPASRSDCFWCNRPIFVSGLSF
jgi:hypothetical protein